jgi:hypothetical protein
MSELNAEVKEFFDGYERANTDFEPQRIATFYADVFMFGAPQGVQSVKKEDFVRVLPRRKEFFKSAGLVSSKVESLEASKLDSKYVLAFRSELRMASSQAKFYASPPSSPGGSIHGCHSSTSAWASQNHLPHVGQCTVAG